MNQINICYFFEQKQNTVEAAKLAFCRDCVSRRHHCLKNNAPSTSVLCDTRLGGHGHGHRVFRTAWRGHGHEHGVKPVSP